MPVPEFKSIEERIAWEVGEIDAPQMMAGGYEGASRHSRELASWSPLIRSADGDVLRDKPIADARSIDMIRNDAYAASGAQLHKDNVVGAMYMLNAKPQTTVLGLDQAWADEFSEEVEAKFTLWAESLNHWVDASRRNTLTSMIRLSVGVYLHSGEVLLTSEWLRQGQRPYRTAFQMIELNRLCNPQTLPYDQTRVKGGVETSVRGEEIAFYIRRALPGTTVLNNEAYTWSRVRARNSFGRPQVLHIMEQQRPDQTRGMSQLMASIKQMRSLQKFQDLELQKAIINASFAASIESELPAETVFAQLGAGNVGDHITAYAANYLGAVSDYTDGARNMQIDGVKIPHLFPGTKLNVHAVGHPEGIGQEFEQSLLRYMAASLDVSYEELSKDYSQTSYASARAGMLQTWKASQSRKKMVADRVATAVYRNWFEEALGAGDIEAMKGRSVPNFYEGLNVEAYTQCEWIGAARGQIDELKETQAALLRVKGNLSTLEDELGRQGKDWRKVLQQQAREKAMLEELGLDIDPEQNALNAASGEVSEAGDGTEEPRGGAGSDADE